MIALMLAAGVGRRLYGGNDDQPPKCLLRFAGETLLQRHITHLRERGISGLVMVVGYRADDIRSHVADIGAEDFVRFVENPRFTEGSVISMAAASDVLTSGEAVFFMDADVLYDAAIMDRMLSLGGYTVFPYDSEFEPGDEPVKLCLSKAKPVEFRKIPDDVPHDAVGEWIGFIRLAPDFAAALAERASADSEGPTDAPYEDSVRHLLLNGWAEKTVTVDINGVAWIEIDFPEDVVKAEQRVLPRV